MNIKEANKTLVNKIVYRPEKIPKLKIHIYSEDKHINWSMWKRMVVPGDFLKAL